MPTASTLASVVVALAAIVLVVRWPRPRADRRVLQRRADSLEALGLVVTRSAVARQQTVEHPAEDEPSPTEYRHVAITVLGPVDDRPSEGGGPQPTERHAPLDRPSRTRVRHPAAHRHPIRHPSHHRSSAPTPVIRLGGDDLPPDDDLTETVDRLDGAPQPSTNSAPVAPTPTAPVPIASAPLASTHVAGPRAPRRPRTVRRGSAVAAVVAVVVGGLALSLARPDTGPGPAVPGGAAAAETPAPPPAPDSTLPPPLIPTAAFGDTVRFDLAAPFTLGLAAGDTTWVRVLAASGEILFEGTLAADDSTSVAASGPVQLRVGNPAGLLVAADGRLLDHPRPPGQPLTLALG